MDLTQELVRQAEIEVETEEGFASLRAQLADLQPPLIELLELSNGHTLIRDPVLKNVAGKAYAKNLQVVTLYHKPGIWSKAVPTAYKALVFLTLSGEVNVLYNPTPFPVHELRAFKREKCSEVSSSDLLFFMRNLTKMVHNLREQRARKLEQVAQALADADRVRESFLETTAIPVLTA